MAANDNVILFPNPVLAALSDPFRYSSAHFGLLAALYLMLALTIYFAYHTSVVRAAPREDHAADLPPRLKPPQTTDPTEGAPNVADRLRELICRTELPEEKTEEE